MTLRIHQVVLNIFVLKFVQVTATGDFFPPLEPALNSIVVRAHTLLNVGTSALIEFWMNFVHDCLGVHVVFLYMERALFSILVLAHALLN